MYYRQERSYYTIDKADGYKSLLNIHELTDQNNFPVLESEVNL